MDNVCHTLVGAALAEAGLKRRTALGYATLMIGANFPDIDVASLPFGVGLACRRGWTHGVLALAVLPFVLTALMLWWARRRRAREAPAREVPAQPVVAREILLLAFIAMLTHPALDFMNVYGVRWLMPFSGTWFYGDTLFIVDPWLWLALVVGVWLSRRLARRQAEPRPCLPARIALGASAAYIAFMGATTSFLRARVEAQLHMARASDRKLMVAPVAGNSLRRDVVYDAGGAYRFGRISLVDRRLVIEPDSVLKGPVDAAIARAAATAEGRAFVSWARFPFFRVTHAATQTEVAIGDARYTRTVHAGFGSVTISLPARVSRR